MTSARHETLSQPFGEFQKFCESRDLQWSLGFEYKDLPCPMLVLRCGKNGGELVIRSDCAPRGNHNFGMIISMMFEDAMDEILEEEKKAST